MANRPGSGSAQAAPDATWYALSPAEVADRLQVDHETGLSPDQAAQRLQEYGPNALAEAKAEPVWQKFLTAGATGGRRGLGRAIARP